MFNNVKKKIELMIEMHLSSQFNNLVNKLNVINEKNILNYTELFDQKYDQFVNVQTFLSHLFLCFG